MPLLLAWKIKFGLKIQSNAWGNDRILYHETNKEAPTVLWSVVKHLGSGRALKKWGKTLDFVPLHFFRALPLPACFTTEKSTVEASLFVNYHNPRPSRTSNIFPVSLRNSCLFVVCPELKMAALTCTQILFAIGMLISGSVNTLTLKAQNDCS